MTETKNTNTTYNEMDIARVLINMSDAKKDLLCSILKLGELKELACNKDKYTNYLSNVEKCANMYVTYVEALKEFHKTV